MNTVFTLKKTIGKYLMENEEVEAITRAIEYVNRDISKHPKIKLLEGIEPIPYCPTCGLWLDIGVDRCKCCGQWLDWTVVEE